MCHELTKSVLKPVNRKVEATAKMPPPSDRQGVIRLIGMATYLARYTYGVTVFTSPMREILK